MNHVKKEIPFTLTILGSSSALPTSKRFPPAHLLNVNERFFLIDCGEGTQIQLRRYKFRFGKVNHIFISHIHGDHLFGLFGLLSSFQLMGRDKDLHLYAPGELRDIVGFYEKHFSHEHKFRIIVHPLGYRRKKLIYTDDWLEVYSIPLKHRIPACGFLFRELPQELNIIKESIDRYKPSLEQIVAIKRGMDLVCADGTVVPSSELTYPPWKTRSYAYLSDTAYNPSMAKTLENPDLLFHESTFSHADESLALQTYHSTSVQAAKLAKMAGAGKLLLGHFSSRYKEVEFLAGEAREFFPETYIVNDGDVFQVERVRMGNK
jgi:ribonuclease Z